MEWNIFGEENEVSIYDIFVSSVEIPTGTENFCN